MAQTRISDAQITVDNETIGWEPNTASLIDGEGEVDVSGVVIGPGKTEIIISTNPETAVGQMMFEIPTTKANMDFVRQWKRTPGEHVIKLVAKTPDGTLTRTMTSASLANDPEQNIGNDGAIPLEWKGNKIG